MAKKKVEQSIKNTKDAIMELAKHYLVESDGKIELKLKFAFPMSIDGNDFVTFPLSNIDRFESNYTASGFLATKVFFKNTIFDQPSFTFDITPLAFQAITILAEEMQKENDRFANLDRIKSRSELLDLD